MALSGNEFGQINKIIHEPARLSIMAVLSECEQADFKYLMNATELTKGNLSSHLAKLENAKYVTIEKKFVGKLPLTTVSITKSGLVEFKNYIKWLKQVMNKI